MGWCLTFRYPEVGLGSIDCLNRAFSRDGEVFLTVLRGVQGRVGPALSKALGWVSAGG